MLTRKSICSLLTFSLLGTVLVPLQAQDNASGAKPADDKPAVKPAEEKPEAEEKPAIPKVENPLKAFPASTAVTMRLKQPGKTIGKLTAFGTQVDPQVGGMLALAPLAMGAAISNQAMAGVDREGDWWYAVFANGQDEPSIVMAVPYTDVDAMKAGILNGENMTFVTYENWLLYTDDADLGKELEAHLTAKDGKSLSLDPTSSQTFTEGDLSIYVNVPAIRGQYANELADAKLQIDDLIEEMKNQVPETPGIDMTPIWEMYRGMFKGLLQGVDDTEGLTVTMTFSEKALLISEYVHFSADSKTLGGFKKHATSPLAMLQKLPGNQMAYMALSGDLNHVSEWAMNFAGSMVPAENKETKEQLEKFSELFKQVKYQSYSSAFSLVDNKDGALRGVVAVEASPAEKVKEMARTMATQAQAFTPGQGIESEIKIEEEAETYGPYKADVLTVKQTIDENIDPLGVQKAMNQVLYGSDTVTSRMIYTKDGYIQTLGGGKELMSEVVKSLDGEPGSKETTSSVARAALPEKTNFVAMLDLASLALEAGKIFLGTDFAQQLNIPVSKETLSGIEINRSYIGFSAGVEEQGVRFVTSVPAEQVKNMVTIGRKIEQSMQGQPEL